MAADMELINAIASLEQEVKDAKLERKRTNEALQNEIESMPTHIALQSAREAHIAAMAGDGEVQRLKDDMAEHNRKCTDLQDILSHHLTEYFAKTGEKAVPVPDGREEPVNEKPIEFKAKLGKVRPHQEQMFPTSGGRSYQISAGDEDKALVIDEHGTRTVKKSTGEVIE